MSINNKEIGLRLKELRENKNISQTNLSRKFSKDYTMGKSGKNTISQLERGARGLTIDFACEYAKYFNVSLDYLYGQTKNWKPEYKEIKEYIGLSDNTINKLEEINHNDKTPLYVLDYLFNMENEKFIKFLSLLQKYATYDKESKAILSDLAKDLINTQNKKSNKDLDTILDMQVILLFKITELTKSIANDFKANEYTNYINEKFDI